MKKYAIVSLLLLTTFRVDAKQEYWPQWRGPNHNGVSEAVDLPTTWSTSENVVWSRKLPSWSGSTPVVWGERVFLLSPNTGEEIQGGEKPAFGLLVNG